MIAAIRLVSAFLCLSLPLLSHLAMAEIRPGDVNLDGGVDAEDAELLAHHLETDWLACAEEIAADVVRDPNNLDLDVNQEDLEAIADPNQSLPSLPNFPPYPTLPAPANESGSPNVSFMSFNACNAGWPGHHCADTIEAPDPFRGDLVVKIVGEYAPDVVGLQEGLGTRDVITSGLSGYSLVPIPSFESIPGESQGQDGLYFEAMVYRSDRFTLLESTPYRVPNLVCGLLSSNRFVSWAYFEEKESGNRFNVYNLHFCPGGGSGNAENRKAHARYLVELIENLDNDDPVILLGDFNETPGSGGINILEDAGFIHTYGVIEELSTGGTRGGALIDYVFVSGWGLETCGVKVDRQEGYSEAHGDLPASDHWPVIAQVQLIDRDGDRIIKENDNCPDSFNPDQSDADDDGSGDACDNCLPSKNPDQVDTDSDGLGNRCDADLDQSGVVDDDDFTLFQEAYNASAEEAEAPFYLASDFNATGTVNVQDFGYFSQLYNGQPQMGCQDSALACCDMTLTTPTSFLAGTDAACDIDGPKLSAWVNGQEVEGSDSISVGFGCPIEFRAEAHDPDRLGFSLELGEEPRDYVWQFGDRAVPAAARESFGSDAVVQLELGDGQISEEIEVTVTAYDSLGFSTIQRITLRVEGEDVDQDGVVDWCDNCTGTANRNQADSDRDGYGNHCDGDFTIPADDLVEATTAPLNEQDDYCWGFLPAIGGYPWLCGEAQNLTWSCVGDEAYDPRADMNATGCVNVQDYGYFVRQISEGVSGPSGLACAGEVPGSPLCGVRADDDDGDGVLNLEDNCPEDWNPGQSDVCGIFAAACGLGWELVLVAPVFLLLQRRRIRLLGQ